MVILLQISSAQGPVECCRAVALALKRITEEAKASNVKLELLECCAGPTANTFRSVVLTLEGEQADALVQRWQGTVQWVCPSAYRKGHKRKNWFIGITTFSIEEQAHFNPDDVRFETMRASGAGGQHVNKTESAVRAIHEPSGISVRIESERSQHQNKRTALLLLAHQLQERQTAAQNQQRNQQWEQHYQLERGNPVLTISGEKFLPL